MSGEVKSYKRDDAPFKRPDARSKYETQIVNRVSIVRKDTKGGDVNEKNKYAQKTILLGDYNIGSAENAKQEIRQEVQILRHAQHFHVIKFIDAYILEGTSPSLEIIMDLADGNIQEYLKCKRQKPQELNQMQQWVGCLAGAVEYIHGIGIRHRDIKPQNILVKSKRYSETKQVFLADFGLSKMRVGQTLSTTVPGRVCGRTPAYCAPEVDSGSSRGQSADIFSLGAVFLEIVIARSYPLEQQNLIRRLARSGEGQSYAKNLDRVHKFIDKLPKENSDDWSREILKLCRKMLQKDRDDRPNASRVRTIIPPLPTTLLPECECTKAGSLSLNEALVNACKDGHAEEVERLVTAGASPSTIGAIHQASACGYPCIVQFLLDQKAKTKLVKLGDHSKQTALHCAAGNGNEGIVGILLEHKASATIRDVEGRTALHYAAGAGNVTIVEMLLYEKRGKADASAVDENGQTALHFAAKRGHARATEKLLSRMEDCKRTDKKKRTALHFAAGFGSVRTVSLLLKGSDVNAVDGFGSTALHFAAQGNRESGHYKEVVALLLAGGADVKILDNNGLTAYNYASEALKLVVASGGAS